MYYAKFRIDHDQPINSVVLIGPTFSEQPSIGTYDPDNTFEDQADYLGYITNSGADVLVIDDKANWGEQAKDFQSPGSGLFLYDYWDINHYSPSDWQASNQNAIDLKKWVFDWIANPHQNQHGRTWYECISPDSNCP